MRTNWKRLLAAGLLGLAPCASIWAEEGASTGSAPPAVDQPAEAGASSAGSGSSSEGDAAAGGTLSGAPSGFGGGGGQAVGSSGGGGGGFGGGGLGGRGGGQPALGGGVSGQVLLGGGLGSTSEGGLSGSITVVGVGPGGAGIATMPNSLEEAIGLAMRANPEVQLARAKVDEARASYNQTRLRIVAELTQIYRQREALQQDNALEAEASAAKVKSAKEATQQNEKLRATGVLPEGALQQAIDAARSAELDHQRVVLGHRQKLASFDTQLMLLMGLESAHASDASLRYFREGEGGGNSRGMMGSFFGGVGGPGMPGMGGGGAAGGGGGTIGAGGGSSGGGHAASGGPAGGGGAPTGGGGDEGSAPAGAGSSSGGGPAGAGSGEGGAATGGGGAPQANSSAQQLFNAFAGMSGAPGGGMRVVVPSMGGNGAAANSRPSIPESQKHLRDELEKVTALDVTDSPLADVVTLLKQQHGIEMQMGPGVVYERPITMSVSGLKLKDMFLLMTDLYPDLCFVVRDYGLLITTREKGMELYGAAIPADLPLLTAPPTPRTVVY